MMTISNAIPSRKLESTVKKLCEIITSGLDNRPARPWDDHALRKELVGCILGSQVRYESAVAATESLEAAGLLSDQTWFDSSGAFFEAAVRAVLAGQSRYSRVSHRFPKARASQLAGARTALNCISLRARLGSSDNPRSIRRSLISDVPGLGPKQSSMFLRNVGVSHDLAILDTHVIRFLGRIGLLKERSARLSTLSGYEQVELVIIEYANGIGYPVGHLDLAIWATMKASQELTS